MYTRMCDWVTLLCSRKLKEHCKSAIMEKTKIIIKEISHLKKKKEIPRLGVQLELQLLPAPQPQQCQIRALSATNTTAHGNAGSLIH